MIKRSLHSAIHCEFLYMGVAAISMEIDHS